MSLAAEGSFVALGGTDCTGRGGEICGARLAVRADGTWTVHQVSTAGGRVGSVHVRSPSDVWMCVLGSVAGTADPGVYRFDGSAVRRVDGLEGNCRVAGAGAHVWVKRDAELFYGDGDTLSLVATRAMTNERLAYVLPDGRVGISSDVLEEISPLGETLRTLGSAEGYASLSPLTAAGSDVVLNDGLSRVLSLDASAFHDVPELPFEANEVLEHAWGAGEAELYLLMNRGGGFSGLSPARRILQRAGDGWAEARGVEERPCTDVRTYLGTSDRLWTVCDDSGDEPVAIIHSVALP